MSAQSKPTITQILIRQSRMKRVPRRKRVQSEVQAIYNEVAPNVYSEYHKLRYAIRETQIDHSAQIWVFKATYGRTHGYLVDWLWDLNATHAIQLQEAA